MTIRETFTLQEYRLVRDIEAFFARGRCLLFARGCAALYAELRTMQLPRNANVLMTGHTSMIVASAVK